jgi:hypothetical protein
MKVKIDINGFDKIEKENISNIKKTHPETVEHLDHTIKKFYRTFSGLVKVEQSKKNIYLKGYIIAIANNLVVCRKLFIGGWHFQLQIILRTQIEQITNLVAMTFDDEFFKYFTTTKDHIDKFLPFTPKQTHLNKALKRIKNSHPQYGQTIEEMVKGLQPAYEEFSNSVHGNFLQTTLLSTFHDEDGKVTFSIGGSANVYPRTENYLRSILNFSQIFLHIVERKLLETGDMNFEDLEYKIDIDETIMLLDNV